MKFRGVLFGAVIGAAAGLLFAPGTGRHTRALIRDKAIRYSKDTQKFVDKKSRHIANKTHGYMHEIKGVLARGKDHVEEEREAVEA